GWFIVLSEQIDPHVAMRAANGWGGDEYVSYRTSDQRACTRIRFEGDTPKDTGEMRDALRQWTAAVPGIAASVTDEGRTVLFQSCDPGTKAKVATNRSLDAMSLPVGRVALLQGLVEDGAQVKLANCVANGVIDQSTVAQINDPTGAFFQSAAGQQRL